MAAQLAAPAQGEGAGGGGGGAGGASPSAVRELIVIPEISNSIHLQHAIQQVSSSVVDVNGDSSGNSSPSADAQHTFITVATRAAWCAGASLSLAPLAPLAPLALAHIKTEHYSDQECEGGNGVNYHVQYVTEPQEIYTQGHQTTMEGLRSYPVYGVAGVAGLAGGAGLAGAEGADGAADAAWPADAADYTAYGVVVAGDEAEAGSSPATPAAPRMPPATVQWLLDHYETADGVSLPRSTLYSHYLRHCAAHRLEPVNAASFGKLIRSVFIGLRTRRLGTRGNSKYHYYGIRAKPNANNVDVHHDGHEDKTDVLDAQEGRSRSSEREAASSPASSGGGGGGGASGGAGSSVYRQYLGSMLPPDPPDLAVHELPPDVPPAAVHALRRHHREYGASFLCAVSALDTGGVERARRWFWRGSGAGVLCRRVLWRLAGRADVARWLRAADLQLHQRAVDLLLPDVLRPIPPQLTQAIRNFAKSVEAAVCGGAGGGGGASGGGGVPAASARAQARAAGALAGALRRYTSLNHLAQAARAVLTNHHQIHQMLADLNRVDFRVVREQAAWACSCGSDTTAQRLEADFKATLGRGASLEQWAGWLDACVRAALAPHERVGDHDDHGDRADRGDLGDHSDRSDQGDQGDHTGYTARARRLLLDWSFYSSLVIRELTLRSAASFGSFHLIRLLYDEYVSYVIERRVAAHRRVPPIAVMHRVLEEDEEVCEENTADVEEEEGEWEWDDDEEEDDDPPECKKTKMQCE